MFGITRIGCTSVARESWKFTDWIIKINARVAQLVERQPSKLNVAGSNPVSRSKNLRVTSYESQFINQKSAIVN